MKKLIIALSFVLVLAGCRNTTPLLPSVSGKAGEIIVVMEKADWEGALGGAARGLLGRECPYLAQREPLYTLVNVTPSAFVDLFKVHRNIVLFNVNPQIDSACVVYKHDVWAAPQCVIQVSAYDADGAIALLDRSGRIIEGSIEQAERDRVIRNTLRYEERSLFAQTSEVFGGSPHFPSGYSMKKKTQDFVWIADDKQYVYQDVLIYRYPATDAEPFSAENIIAHRNEILMANIPGMFDGTYMTTSEYFEPQVESLKYKGRQFMQTRGMWEVYNDYMGGPFVSHSFYSQDGQEIIVVEAFVYAPRYDKRQYLRQVESLLYSWEWKAE